MLIAVCDDNRQYINIVEEYFDKIKNIFFGYDVFEDGEELVKMYENHNADYDAILLDMEMKNLNGIETANLIRKMDKQVIIIFITSHTQYMQKSFECSPFRFLIKPINLENLQKLFDDICTKLKDESQTIVFTENRRRVRLFCEDIIFFESQLHCIWIHTPKDTYKIYKSFSELCLQLNGNTFVRVHKSFIVNLSYIKEIKETEITLYNYECSIPLSRTYKKNLMNRFIDFKERKFLL